MTTTKIQILPLRRPQLSYTSPSSLSQPPKSSFKTPTSSTDDDDHPAVFKRRRASKPKVRTGCQTCKIRRVKCDETKPACTKCTSTGRKCDGYVDPPPKKKRASPAVDWQLGPSRELDIMEGSASELRALEYFCLKTAPNMGMYFDADFWNRLVIQASAAEPAIKHAMVAVGSLHEQRELGVISVPQTRAVVITDPRSVTESVVTSKTDNNDPFALSHYNRSINLLAQRMNNTSESTEIALLACILFCCLEFLRGDVEPALNHFKGGMGIIIGTLAQNWSTRQEPALHRIRENVMPFFNRLEMLSTLFGNDSSWDYPVALNCAVPDTFDDMNQARDSLVHLMNLSLRFIRRMKYCKYNKGGVTSEAYAEQDSLKQQYNDWRIVFENYLAINTALLTANDLYAANVLEIHRLIGKEWLSVCTSPYECSHDAFNDDFETIVNLAEQMHLVVDSPEQKARHTTAFLFDMEVVSPLYYVGFKCRHPQTRRRAMALLRSMHRRESLWDSNMATAVVERVMFHEEAAMEAFDGSELPDEKMRIHNAYIQSESGIHPNRHMITFQKKPDGLSGYWKIWQEQIVLEPEEDSVKSSPSYCVILPDP